VKHLFLDTHVMLSFHFADAENHQQKAIDYIFTSPYKAYFKKN